MEKKHTPLPWTVQPVQQAQGEDAYQIDQADFLTDSMTMESNAEFIVRACNSHYDLINVLDMLLNNDEVEIFDKAIELGGHRSFSFKEWAEKARSTLTKAKGDQP